MQYFFGGPNWQINKINKISLQLIFCVCGLCGCGISFSGASNIRPLVNYMYIISAALNLYWWNTVWFIGENTISNYTIMFQTGK